VKKDEIYKVDRPETSVLIIGDGEASLLEALQGVYNHPPLDLFCRAEIVLHSET
jgi:hypothetical protein